MIKWWVLWNHSSAIKFLATDPSHLLLPHEEWRDTSERRMSEQTNMNHNFVPSSRIDCTNNFVSRVFYTFDRSEVQENEATLERIERGIPRSRFSKWENHLFYHTWMCFCTKVDDETWTQDGRYSKMKQ